MIDASTQKTLNRLEARGLPVTTDPEFLKMAPWVRTTCIACAMTMAVGTALGSTAVLWFLFVVAAIGVVTPRHPFDAIYNHGIRRFTGTRPLPPNGAPTRFAYTIATTWIGATAMAFQTGHATLGTWLGFAMVAVVVHVAVTNLCPPSLLYQYLFGDKRLIWPAIAGGQPA